MAIACSFGSSWVMELNGVAPYTIWYRMQPSDQMSEARPILGVGCQRGVVGAAAARARTLSARPLLLAAPLSTASGDM